MGPSCGGTPDGAAPQASPSADFLPAATIRATSVLGAVCQTRLMGTEAEVVDAPERSRYEIVRDGTVVGHAAYQLTDQLVVFTHTEVDPAMEGLGIGGRLVRGALDDVRTRDLKVLPICPFVQAWMSRHPEYADLDYRRPESRVSD